MNPFRVVEIVLKTILYAVSSAALAFLLILLPIFAISNGEPWFVALAGWLAIGGFVLLIACCAWVSISWEEAKSRWDRRSSARKAARS